MTALQTKRGGTTGFAGRDRGAEREAMLARATQLAQEAETDGDAAARIIRVMAHNLTISARNACLLASADCPPVATRYFGAWKAASYRVCKGAHGYPTLVRTSGKGYRVGWRFAALDVETSKGAGPAFRHPGHRPVSRETVEECKDRMEGDTLAGLILAAIGGAVESPPCSLVELEAARQAVLTIRDDSPCLYCGFEGEGDGGCIQCR